MKEIPGQARKDKWKRLLIKPGMTKGGDYGSSQEGQMEEMSQDLILI